MLLFCVCVCVFFFVLLLRFGKTGIRAHRHMLDVGRVDVLIGTPQITGAGTTPTVKNWPGQSCAAASQQAALQADSL